ncbi:MAG: hypothetical protein JSU04_07280 [Bdellovibrionales bacterium]|nr:hypothetical protein [Bdellovibrionales bacterium]
MSTSQKYLFAAIVVGLLGFFYFQHQQKTVEATTASQSTQPLQALPAVKASVSTTEKPIEITKSSAPSQAAAAQPAAATNDATGEMSEEMRQKVYSEIKVQLSSLYTAEKAFYAEYNRYSSDLKTIGWLPDPGEMNIKVGFAEASVGEVNDGEDPEGRMDSDFLQAISVPDASYGYSKWAQGLSLKNLSGQCRNGCRASEHRFEIMAVSRTGPGGEPEVWVMNDDKEMIKVTEPSHQ